MQEFTLYFLAVSRVSTTPPPLGSLTTNYDSVILGYSSSLYYSLYQWYAYAGRQLVSSIPETVNRVPFLTVRDVLTSGIHSNGGRLSDEAGKVSNVEEDRGTCGNVDWVPGKACRGSGCQRLNLRESGSVEDALPGQTRMKTSFVASITCVRTHQIVWICGEGMSMDEGHWDMFRGVVLTSSSLPDQSDSSAGDDRQPRETHSTSSGAPSASWHGIETHGVLMRSEPTV